MQPRLEAGSSNNSAECRADGAERALSTTDGSRRPGTDFCWVPVHTNADEIVSAGSLNAKGYTAGNNLFEGLGSDSPKQGGVLSLAVRRIQAKLEVGSRSDPLEREADQAAERVLNIADGNREFHSEVPIQRRTGSSASILTPSGRLSHAEVPQSPQAQTGRNQAPVSGAAPAMVEHVLRQPGEPLDARTEAFFQTRFGFDFSGVRLHTNADAIASARSLNAKAYTAGNNVVVGRGGLGAVPSNSRLLAHELAHVVQQARGFTLIQRDGPEPPAEERPSAEEKTPPKDTRKGTLISAIVINLQTARVAFLTNQGPPIRGDVSTDLDPGSYTVKPDRANQNWVFSPAPARGGLRFTVALEGALPWTLSYPDTVPVQVGAGLTEEGEHSLVSSQNSLLDLIDGKDYKGAFALLAGLSDVDLADLLNSLKTNHEDAVMLLLTHFKAGVGDPASNTRLLIALEAMEWDQSKLFVDTFTRFYVDPTSFTRDKEREKAGKWNIKIFFSYGGLTPERAILIYADDIGDGSTKSKGLPKYGTGGLLYPDALNRGNTPRMWQAKKDVIAKIEEQNYEFIFTSWAVTEQVLGLVQLGQALIVATLPGATTGGAASAVNTRGGASARAGAGGSTEPEVGTPKPPQGTVDAPPAAAGQTPARATPPTNVRETGFGGYRATWKGDQRALIAFEPEGKGVNVTDVFRGGQPPRTGGQMLADSLKAAGHGRPSTIKISGIINEPTVEALAKGTPPRDTVLGGTLSSSVDELGGRITNWSSGETRGKPWIAATVVY
jgi:hypothetical protein